MQLGRTLEQQIAVFGERGSGKTVLLSSFYGATQEPEFSKKHPFHVLADDFSQGNRLHRNYLGMKDSTQVPPANRFSATSYSFSVKLKDASDPGAKKARPFDALRLVWHDYPGEWFEQNPSGPEEATRRVDTFRALLGCHVALLLVDAQKLLDNKGEEERYLKSLLANYRNGLLSLKDEILEDGKPLVQVPRIWIFALSKSDLLPHMNVFNFRDLLVSRTGDEMSALREVIAGFVDASDEALSVGEDFLLLSSAKFSPGKIEVTRRVGLELILPLAAMLPFERHVRWAEFLQKGSQVAESLLGGAKIMAYVLTGVVAKNKLPGPLGKVLAFIVPWLSDAAEMAGSKLSDAQANALAQQDHLRAALTGFRIDLENAEERRILIRSPR